MEDLDTKRIAVLLQSHFWAGVRDPKQIDKNFQLQKDCDYEQHCLIVITELFYTSVEQFFCLKIKNHQKKLKTIFHIPKN